MVCPLLQRALFQDWHQGKLLPSTSWLPLASLPRRPVKQFGVTQAAMASQRGLLFSFSQYYLGWVMSAVIRDSIQGNLYTNYLCAMQCLQANVINCCSERKA